LSVPRWRTHSCALGSVPGEHWTANKAGGVTTPAWGKLQPEAAATLLSAGTEATREVMLSSAREHRPRRAERPSSRAPGADRRQC
jgi:hypothetical protein